MQVPHVLLKIGKVYCHVACKKAYISRPGMVSTNVCQNTMQEATFTYNDKAAVMGEGYKELTL